jgi:hypothetical protein
MKSNENGNHLISFDQVVEIHPRKVFDPLQL